MRPMPNRLVITEIGSKSVALRGEIDAHSAPTLAARFETLPAGDDDIVIDMADVTFMDSSGLRVFIDVHQRAEAESRHLILRSPSQSVTRLLEVAGLSDHFSIDSASATDSN
jgi:anti-anti-sigma factor